jgi:3-phosphoshikimate 1-carboxyvinyltransferase
VPAGSRLYGLEALRHKESDRLAVMVANLSRAGAQVRSDGSSFRVVRPLGSASHGAIPVTAAADHRIAMAMAVAALRAGPLELDDPSCVAKSYPGFWEHWERLVG